MKNILISILILAIVGISICYFRWSQSAENMLKISEASGSAYLVERFTNAYSTQPVNVAIWEGTNLVSFLNENWGASPSIEQCAQLAFIHARLYVLFKEADMSNDAVSAAVETSKWVQKISANSTVTSEIAVSKLLERDTVKRPTRSH